VDNRGAQPGAQLSARDRATRGKKPLRDKARTCARSLTQPCARARGVCNTPCCAVCASGRKKKERRGNG